MIPARFYVIGPRFHGYTRATASALAMCGHESAYTEIDPGHDHTFRGIANYYGGRVFNPGADMRRRQAMAVAPAIISFRPNYLLLIRGDWLTPQDLQDLRRAVPGMKVILWAQDSVLTIPGIDNLHALVDFLALFEPTDLQLPVVQRFAQSLHLPAAFDSECYFPIQSADTQYHLAFVGAPYPDRRDLVESTGALMQKQSMRLCVAGNFSRSDAWSMHRFRKRYPATAAALVARAMHPREVNALYSQSMAVLNMHHAQSRQGFNPRTVEILASGRPQLLDHQQQLSSTFAPDQCVLYYETPKDALDQLSRLQRSAELRARISRDAIAAAAPHSLIARMRQLTDTVQA
ncbi:MAG: glycosyltransferase [bacterium]|nr:glycosyltransferase [bacterium]